jgi:hypothetical protein
MNEDTVAEQGYLKRLVDCLLLDEEGREFIRQMLSPKESFPDNSRKLHESQHMEEIAVRGPERQESSETRAEHSIPFDFLSKFLRHLRKLKARLFAADR